MADRYLLRCECGADLIVEPRNAGQQVSCGCGQQLKAPSLRNLRELPRAPDEAPSSNSGGWSFQQGVFTCGLLVAASLAGAGLYLWVNGPTRPAAYSAETRNEQFALVIEDMTPAQAFLVWWQHYNKLSSNGFTPMDDSARQVEQRRYSRAQTVWTSLLGAAAVVALGSVLGFVCFSAGAKRDG